MVKGGCWVQIKSWVYGERMSSAQVLKPPVGSGIWDFEPHKQIITCLKYHQLFAKQPELHGDKHKPSQISEEMHNYRRQTD